MTEAIEASAWPVGGIPGAGTVPAPTLGGHWSLATLLAHISDRSACLGVADRRAWLRNATDACARLLSVREQLILALVAHDRMAKLACVAGGRQEPLAHAQGSRTGLLRIDSAMQACVDEVLGQWQLSGQRFARVLLVLPTQLDPCARLPEDLAPDAMRASVARVARCTVQGGDGLDGLLWRHAQAYHRCHARRLAARLAKDRRRSLDQTVGVLTLPALDGLANALLDEYLSRQALLQAQADCASVQWEIDCLATARSPARGAPAANGEPLLQCTAGIPATSPSFDGVWNHKPAKAL